MTTIKYEFSPEDIEAFKPSMKVGLVGCKSFDGLPHIAMITSMQAKDAKTLLMGEFCFGLSKQYMQKNHHLGFLIMSIQKELWRGKATWTHLAKSGVEYDLLNQIPMFRYNTYFGINTVHYADLVETSEKEALPMSGIVMEAIKTRLSKGSARTRNPQRILKPFIEDIFNQLTSLKFISYIGEDDYPVIIPIVQCQAADSRRLAFTGGVYKEELQKIPVGGTVAVFCMNFGIEDVLVRGTFNGFKKSGGVNLASVDINWVYNCMPPALGQVYPEVPVSAVTAF